MGRHNHEVRIKKDAEGLWFWFCPCGKRQVGYPKEQTARNEAADHMNAEERKNRRNR